MTAGTDHSGIFLDGRSNRKRSVTLRFANGLDIAEQDAVIESWPFDQIRPPAISIAAFASGSEKPSPPTNSAGNSNSLAEETSPTRMRTSRSSNVTWTRTVERLGAERTTAATIEVKAGINRSPTDIILISAGTSGRTRSMPRRRPSADSRAGASAAARLTGGRGVVSEVRLQARS